MLEAKSPGFQLTSAEVMLASCPHVSCWTCIFFSCNKHINGHSYIYSPFLWRSAVSYLTEEIEMVLLLSYDNLVQYVHTRLGNARLSNCFQWRNILRRLAFERPLSCFHTTMCKFLGPVVGSTYKTAFIDANLKQRWSLTSGGLRFCSDM